MPPRRIPIPASASDLGSYSGGGARVGTTRSVVDVLWMSAAPSRRFSSSVHGLALTCQLRPPTSSQRSCMRTRERATARSLSVEAQHVRLRRSRAAPCMLESSYALRKSTTPSRRSFLSVHGRASTCQPRPPTSSRRSRVRTRERATARSLSGGGAACALAARACCAALAGAGPCPMEAHCASEAALSLDVRPRSDVPAAASNE